MLDPIAIIGIAEQLTSRRQVEDAAQDQQVLARIDENTKDIREAIERMIGRKFLYIAILSFALAGCSGLGAITSLLPTPGIEAEANVGKEVESTDKSLVIKEDTIKGNATKADQFASVQAEVFTYTQEIPVWVWLIMILGWVLPSPIEIYKGFGNLLINIKRFIINDLQANNQCSS